MSDPFARAWDRTDFYTASIVGLAQIFKRSEDAFSVLDAIEPGEHHSNLDLLDTPDAIVSITSRYVFVSIAGTQGFQQWVLNVLGSIQVPDVSLTGLVSAWFEFVGGTLWGVLNPIVSPHLSTKRLVVMGHSLGGAAAQVLAGRWKNAATAGLICYALGCPRVGNPGFAAFVGDFVFRCENSGDPIVALPPSLWGGVNVLPPMPSPAMPVIYEHAGLAKTLDGVGTLSDGSNPMPLLQVLDYFKDRTSGTHVLQLYAQRLRIGLPPELTPANTGYVDPSMVDAVFKSIAPGSVPFLPHSVFDEGASGMKRFMLFFNIGTRAGYTEDFWADVSPSTYGPIIADYLDKRLAMCAAEVVFKYCRISDVPATRKVSWRNASDFVNTTGKFSAAAMAAPEQALDLRLKMEDNSPGRIFLHGFPKTQFDGENYTPTPAFESKVNNFKSLIQNGTYLFESQSLPHTPAARFGISSITPQPPRGCVIVPATIPGLTVGDTVQIGGEGARILGLNGRKKVIAVGAGGANFTVGGAQPVGNPADLAAGAYFYTCDFQYLQPQFGGIVALTTHKVGRPFGVRPGRRENLIPLRQ